MITLIPFANYIKLFLPHRSTKNQKFSQRRKTFKTNIEPPPPKFNFEWQNGKKITNLSFLHFKPLSILLLSVLSSVSRIFVAYCVAEEGESTLLDHLDVDEAVLEQFVLEAAEQ